MIWDEARWDGKIKEKWGKSYPDEAVAGRLQDYRDMLRAARIEELHDADQRDTAA